jgi:signal transduction histidine kinase
MLNYQGNQDFVPIDISASESRTLHLPQIAEPVSVPKFLDRIMQYQVDPALIGRQICQIIATNSDRKMLLLQIANTLGTVYQADYCLVAAVTDKKVAIPHGCWQIRSDRSNSSNIVADLTQTSEFSQITILNSPLISPVLAQVLADGEVAEISDIQDGWAANVSNSVEPSLPFRAILVAPVRFGGTINGMIIVGKSQPYEWSAADRQQLEAVSDSIAIAIAHIQKTQQLQQQAKYQKLLRTVASSIDTNSELAQILQQIIENTTQTLQVDRGKILLLKYTDPLFPTRSPNQTPTAKVELVCETTLKTEIKSTAKTKNKYFWLSESSWCDRAFNRAPQSLALGDTSEFIREEHPKAAEILNLKSTRSLLIVPLLSANGQGTILGFLVLQHSEPRAWGLEELEVVESVAAQVTTAIIQTQTLKQIQALVEDRTSQLQRSLDVQAVLYEQTRRQVEQLRKLNQLKDEFVDTMSDALRHPLTKMRTAIWMLKNANPTPESQANLLETLETECIQEIALINDVLKLQELESLQASFPVAEINLECLIQDVVQEFDRKLADHPKLANQGLTLTVDLPKPMPCLETHWESLKYVILELLTNAGKFSASRTAVVLEVSQTASHTILSVSNFGRGISAEDLPHIFEKFRRGTGVTEKGIAGTGLGLALVKCLVQHLNGTIDVSSSRSSNSETAEVWRTCFTLTLPQFPEKISNLEE